MALNGAAALARNIFIRSPLLQWCSGGGPMKTAITLAMTAAGLAASLLTPVSADPMRLAQMDADVRRGAPPRGPGVVVEEPRPPAVAIETEGRGGRDCRFVTVDEWRDGVKVTRAERRCD
jgi:hypothetical protein